MSFCSLIKGLPRKFADFIFVLINSVLLNLSCVWIYSFGKNKCIEVRFKWVQRGFLSERKRKFIPRREPEHGKGAGTNSAKSMARGIWRLRVSEAERRWELLVRVSTLGRDQLLNAWLDCCALIVCRRKLPCRHRMLDTHYYYHKQSASVALLLRTFKLSPSQSQLSVSSFGNFTFERQGLRFKSGARQRCLHVLRGKIARGV